MYCINSNNKMRSDEHLAWLSFDMCHTLFLSLTQIDFHNFQCVEFFIAQEMILKSKKNEKILQIKQSKLTVGWL